MPWLVPQLFNHDKTASTDRDHHEGFVTYAFASCCFPSIVIVSDPQLWNLKLAMLEFHMFPNFITSVLRPKVLDVVAYSWWPESSTSVVSDTWLEVYVRRMMDEGVD